MSKTTEGGPGTATSIAAAIGLTALVGVGLSLLLPLVSLEMERQGMSAGAIGFTSTVAGVAGIVAIPFVPALAARIGVGLVIQIAIGLSGAIRTARM